MRPRFMLLAMIATALTTFFGQSPNASAQIPGVDMPLMTGIAPWSHGITFRQGTVPSDIYYLRLEPTVDPMMPNNQSSVHFECIQGVPWPMPGNGLPVWFPTRSLRWPKEEFHYSAVDWRNVPPGVYRVKAQVNWPDGFGAVTGNWYPAGTETLVLDITITP